MGFVRDFKDQRAWAKLNKEKEQAMRAERWQNHLDSKPKTENKSIKDKAKEAWGNPMFRTGVGIVAAAAGCGGVATMIKHKKEKDSSSDTSVVDVDDYQIDGPDSETTYSDNGPDFYESEGYASSDESTAE